MKVSKQDDMVYEDQSKDFLTLVELSQANSDSVFNVQETDKTIIWNTAEQLTITIDNVPYKLTKNEMIFLTPVHKIDNIELESARMIRFNQPFFCIINHDNEVGSKGLLFFGANGVPIISVDESDVNNFETTWQTFCSEMKQHETLQKEMLQAILKRFLILSVRCLKKAGGMSKLDRDQTDIIREFNYLVEGHFLKHHDVAYYAAKLHKSPKTLSNLFSLVSQRQPLSIIHDRIMVHARRQIGHTKLSIKEIAYDLGFEDIQAFSRFFKNKEGISPLQFRERAASLQN